MEELKQWFKVTFLPNHAELAYKQKLATYKAASELKDYMMSDQCSLNSAEEFRAVENPDTFVESVLQQFEE